jgi:nucleoside-diphosphate-sugar epimerase
MNVLITGANGFSGSHLIELLSQDPTLQLFKTDFGHCDLTNYSEVERLIKEVRPSQIYHLAGSFTNDYAVDYSNNVVATKNILDALVHYKIKCRSLLIGSAAEYGMPLQNPVSENSPLKPLSIYGLTKVFQTHLMQTYGSLYGLDLVMARTFNLFGKGLSKRLFVGHLYDQIEQYKQGKIGKIVLGDLGAERDYIDVTQALLYYRTIMNKGVSSQIYNVASGKPTKIADILAAVLKEQGLRRDIVEETLGKNLNVQQIYADVQKLMSL